MASIGGGLLALAGLAILILRAIDVSSGGLSTLILAALASIGICIVLWLVPKLQSSTIGEDGSKDRFDSENEARKSLAQLIGGIAFLATFYVTWSNYSVERDKATTEEFTKATEQLSRHEIPVRISGAYALERISRSSPRDFENVIDVLAETLRNNVQGDFEKKVISAPDDPPRADDDVQRIIVILGRRGKLSNGIDTAVNLRGADLRGIAAGSGHFEWAIFEDANLQTAYFYRTYLSHAIFIDAKGSVLPVPKLTQPTSIMTGAVQSAKLPQSCDIPDPTRSVPRVASFPLADLSNAKFDSSHFEGAAFDHSILSNTSFRNTALQRAIFIGVDLTSADLTGAHLEGVKFIGTVGPSDSQLAAAITDKCTKFIK